MPFLSLSQKKLQKILNICNQISPKKSDVEIFTFLKIGLSENKVSFDAVNQNLSFYASLEPANLEFSGDNLEFLIKTDVLSGTVGLIKDENVGLDIDITRSTLVVQGSSSKHTLRINTKEVADMVLPETDQQKAEISLEVNSQQLVKSSQVAQVAVGNPKNVYNPEFLSICYSLFPEQNKISIVSTDRYRVVLKNLEIKTKKTVEGKNTGMHNYLINPKGLQLLNSILEEEEDVILEFEKDLLWIASANKKIAIRYGEGDYPDYNKIIPQSFACSFLLNTKEALSALKQVYISARANVNNKSVKMEVDPENQKIKFLSEAPDGYSSESNCALSNYEGGTEAWSQYFNIDYLIDYLSTLQVESFLWEANPGRPSVLSPENQKSTELYLVSGLQK